MSEQQSKNQIRVKSNISKKLMGGTTVSAYGAKLNELSTIGAQIAPEGSLYVILLDRNDSFSPMAKVVKSVMDLDYLYSLRHLQTNPSLAIEFSELAEHMKAIDRIISKRRKSLASINKPRKEVNTNE